MTENTVASIAMQSAESDGNILKVDIGLLPCEFIFLLKTKERFLSSNLIWSYV